MVLLTGLDSIIESLYLDERLTEHSRDGNILVNPVSISYVINKVIIINHKYYPIDNIKILLNNRNKVITRVNYEVDGVKYDPYLLRINDSIRISNEKINIINENSYMLVEHKFDGVNLYYPKPISFYDHYLSGDLTVLGYLMYQLGCDISDVKDDTIFSNLDIIKMNNGFII